VNYRQVPGSFIVKASGTSSFFLTCRNFTEVSALQTNIN
jgi:hypothetical protein